MQPIHLFALAARRLTRAALAAPRLTRAALLSLTIVALGVMSLTSCSTADDLNATNPDAGAYLTLSSVTIDGAMRGSATRTGNFAPFNGFKAGDVLSLLYGYDENISPSRTVYARMNPDGATWTIYSNLDFTTPARVCPNPNNPGESWETLNLSIYFNPAGVVTGADGEKTYSNEVGFKDPATGLFTFYDCLFANTRCTTADNLSTGQYFISPNPPGAISAKLGHNFALLSLPEEAISVTGYPNGYNGISALTASRGDSYPDIAFIYYPGAALGKGTWQAIVPFMELVAFTATLATDGKPATPAATVKVSLATPITPMENTRYPLTLTLTPDKSTVDITGALPGWANNDEQVLNSDGVEGKDYNFAVKGDKTSQWTLLTARGLRIFRDYVNSQKSNVNARLGADINLGGSSSNPWSPIGLKNGVYSGTFEGGGHIISGLYVDTKNEIGAGLFGWTGENASICNLGIENATVLSEAGTAGSLVAYNRGRITNCYAINCNVKSRGGEYSIAGGLVGDHDVSRLTACYVFGGTASATGGANCYAGGLVGKNGSDLIVNKSEIVACYASGTTTATGGTTNYAGGLVGVKYGSLYSCATTQAIGVGLDKDGSSNKITSCTDLRTALIAIDRNDIQCGMFGVKSISEIWVANDAAPAKAPKLFWQK